MTSVRLTPRSTTPVSAQPPARPSTASQAPVKRPVDGFERKSVTAQLLQRGMTGAAVTQLQQRLVSAKFMSMSDFKSGPGVYGPRTEAAVKRLQAFVGLPANGVAGPSTLAAVQSGVRFEERRPVPASPEVTAPMSRALVHARLSETFSDDVTQPMGHRLA